MTGPYRDVAEAALFWEEEKPEVFKERQELVTVIVSMILGSPLSEWKEIAFCNLQLRLGQLIVILSPQLSKYHYRLVGDDGCNKPLSGLGLALRQRWQLRRSAKQVVRHHKRHSRLRHVQEIFDGMTNRAD